MVNRIRDILAVQQSRKQSGFRKGYFTINRNCLINRVIEKHAECNKLLHVAFIDRKKSDLADAAAEPGTWDSRDTVTRNVRVG